MNFRKPSKIQERALPLLLGNPPKNLVGQSQSGTGKTAAFVLNVLSRVDLSTEQMRRTPQALILAPTRELARQIVGVVEVMGQFMEGLVIGTAVPADTSNRPPKMDKPVVIGTPGTVLTLLRKRAMIPNHLKVLVLDEADNMLEQQGLGDQCIRVKACVFPVFQSESPLLTRLSTVYFPVKSKLSSSRQPFPLTSTDTPRNSPRQPTK